VIINERLTEFIKRRAKRLGISVDDVLREGEERPEFLKAAETRAARQGLTTGEVLERDLERLQGPTFPAIDCLMPYEIEEFHETGALSADRRAHLERCVTCRGLLIAKPIPERIEKYVAALAGRRLRAESGRIRDLVIPWLARPDWHPEQIFDWFEANINAAELGLRKEPYREILQAIARDPERERWEQILARRLSELVGAVSSTPGRKWSEPLLVNLFSLSACLGRPEDLADPLWAIWLNDRGAIALWSEAAQRAFLGALIENQKDRRLQTVWQATLEGDGAAPIRPTLRDALRGILRMPPSSADSPRSDADLIGSALKRIAEPMVDSACSDFDQLLGAIKSARPQANWDEILIATADLHQWPAWTVHRLNLFVEREGTYWLWKHAAYTVRHAFPNVLLSRLCNGEVFRIAMPADAIDLVRQIGPILERKRLAWDLPDARGSNVEAAEYLYEIAEGFRKSKPEIAHAMQLAAKDVLEDENVGIISS
jgi:hypothetical protein